MNEPSLSVSLSVNISRDFVQPVLVFRSRRRGFGYLIYHVLRGHRFAAPQQVRLRGGRDFDASLAKQSLNTEIDIASDLRMSSRQGAPDQQAKVERVIAKL